MAKEQTLGDIIKLGDMPLEQKEQMIDAIKYSYEHETEMASQVNNWKLDDNKTSLTYYRQFLPEIDKNTDMYRNGLIEGVTPNPDSINESSFTVTVHQWGKYIPFTDVAKNHSFHELKTRITKDLSNKYASYADEQIADAYLTTANVATGIDLLDLTSLLKLRTILSKNHARKIGGYYILKVPTETASAMLVAFKDMITHTTQKESIIMGELGEIGGFRLVESNLQAFAPTSGKSPFVAYGMNSKGEYPVSKTAYDNNAHIIYKNPGELGNDPLDQRGSIGIKLDGHKVFMYDDSVCVRGNATVTGVAPVATFDPAKYSNIVKTENVPLGLNVNASYVQIKGKGNFQLKVFEADGSDVTSTSTFASKNTAIATVDNSSSKGKITGVKEGNTEITITNGRKVTTIPVTILPTNE